MLAWGLGMSPRRMFREWDPDELDTLLAHIRSQQEAEQEAHRKADVVGDLQERLEQMKGRR